MASKIKVLFVCLGNICRSPMAEAIFREKVKKRNFESFFEIGSCGTANYHVGNNADPRTISTASKNGISMSHCVRQLTDEDLDYYDYILPMDHSNYENILRLSATHKAKVFLIREFDPQGKGKEVPDPYYGNATHFQEVYEILDRATGGLMEEIVEKYKLGVRS